MSGEKIKKIAVKANKRLSGVLLAFLFLIPVIGILKAADILDICKNEMIAAVILIVALSLIPAVCNKILYNEEAITTITLMSMEALLLLISMNPYAELTVVYVLVPVVSLVYCNQKLTQRICLLSYIGMIGICLYRALILEGGGTGSYAEEAIYLTLLKFSLEFLAVTVAVCTAAGFIERLLADGERETEKYGVTAKADGEKAEKKEVVLQETVYDVEGLFRGIEKDMQAMIKGKNKFFELELDEALPVKLFGAKEEIRQALSGICSDLLMYRSEAAIKMRITYHSGIVPKKNQNITLEIKISGYTDITAVTANRAALGYYLSRNIIERLKGSFEDLSNSEEAVFRICLLQRVEDERTIQNSREQRLQEMDRLKRDAAGVGNMSLFHKKIKVLVVDDNRESRKLIDAVLNSMGVQAVCADNGAEAIELLETKEYQMVFMDQMMPGKSGLETVKELRYLDDEYYQDLPIVMMTVNTREEARKEYKEAGFTDCIAKPIQVNEVKSSLRKWIKDDYPLTYAEYKRMQENENEL